jgi:hypothetical protein
MASDFTLASSGPIAAFERDSRSQDESAQNLHRVQGLAWIDYLCALILIHLESHFKDVHEINT